MIEAERDELRQLTNQRTQDSSFPSTSAINDDPVKHWSSLRKIGTPLLLWRKAAPIAPTVTNDETDEETAVRRRLLAHEELLEQLQVQASPPRSSMGSRYDALF